MWKGEVVTREWMAGNLDQAIELCKGKLPKRYDLHHSGGELNLLEIAERVNEVGGDKAFQGPERELVLLRNPLSVRLVRELERRIIELQRVREAEELKAKKEAQEREAKAIRQAQEREAKAQKEAEEREIMAIRQAQEREAKAQKEAERREAERREAERREAERRSTDRPCPVCGKRELRKWEGQIRCWSCGHVPYIRASKHNL
jgi:hypothetical protein